MARDNVPTSQSLDPDRVVKAADPDGVYGTTARYWINQNLPRLVREHLPAAGGRMLDLGCGDGPNAELLASSGIRGQYVGVDLAESPLWPQRSGRRGQLDVEFRAHDAHRLGDLGVQFDGFLSVSAFEHFRDDRQVVAELARCTTPGSRGIVIVPSPFGNLVWGFRHGYRTYTPPRMRRLLEGSGFTLREAIPSGGMGSLCINGTWRGVSLAIGYPVLAAAWIRYGGDRAQAKQRLPWLTSVSAIVQHAHLRSERGRAVHRAVNRALIRLDEQVAHTPTQWVFVVERR